jgi:uncharacterized protein
MPRADEQVFISVEGQQLELAAAKLLSVSIEQSLLLPDAFNIVLVSGLEWLREETFAIGKEVKLEMAQAGGSRRRLLIGEVTGLLPTMTRENHVQLHVRGYDRSHRLLRGRHTRSFIQMSDSDIAARIASELGLGADITATTEVFDYVFQHNETNLEFLQQRASRIGFQAGVDEGDLYFKPVGEPTSRGAATDAVDLRWGDTLEEFEVSRTTPGQATEVRVRGWNPARKEAVVGQARGSDAGPAIRDPRTGADTVRAAFAIDAPLTVVREGVESQTAAEGLAQVISDELQGDFTTAEGVALGDPALTPGTRVRVSGAGAFDGCSTVLSAV